MNLLLVTTSGLLGLLIWVAVACVVIWGIMALIKWSGIQIPEPVRIVFWCVACIALILLIARFFGLLV